MKSDIFKVKPPIEYIEGMLKYDEEGLDNYPEIIDYLKNDYSLAEARKMDVLVRIEVMKYHLNKMTEETQKTSDELVEAKAYIQDMISEYNKM